jgi:hypothetical protein
VASRPPPAKTRHAKKLTKTGGAKVVDDSEDGSEDLAREGAYDRLLYREQSFDRLSMKDKLLFNINSKIKLEEALQLLKSLTSRGGSQTSTAEIALEDPAIKAMNFSEEEEISLLEM